MTLVRLVRELGEASLLRALNQTVANEEDATRIISTGHKAKGREWNRIQIGGDFSRERLKANPDELRLFYVALTRAREEVDIPNDLHLHFELQKLPV